MIKHSNYSHNSVISITLITLFFTFACNKKVEKGPLLSKYFENKPTFSLIGSVVEVEETDNNYFVQMWEMAYFNNMLIVRDKDQSHYYKLVYLDSKIISKFGKIGDGPNELRSDFTRASVDLTNKIAYVSDYPIYYSYSMDSLKRGMYSHPINSIRINTEEDDLIESTASNGYVIGAMFRKRFGVYGLEKRNFQSLGNYEEGTYMSNQAMFFSHPYEKKTVMLERSAEAFTILDYSNGNISLVKDFKGWRSESEESEESGGITRVILGDDAKFCFTNCSISKDYIYALYSGNTRSEISTTTDPSSAKIVYVLDWDGNPVKKLTLDRPVRSIAVDEENQLLYAGAFIDKELKVVRFDLNQSNPVKSLNSD